MKKADLVNAGNELNGLLFEDDEPQIHVDKGAPEMKANIYEAIKLLEPSDTLTKETVSTILECEFAFDDAYFEGMKKKEVEKLQSTLQKIGIWVDADAGDTGAGEGDSLIDQVKNAPTLKDLKAIAKANDEFKSIRSGLTKYDDVDELIEAMVELLGVEPAEEAKEESGKKDKKDKKEKEGKSDKKEKKGKGEKKDKSEKKDKKDKPAPKVKRPGVIATIVSSLDGAGKKGLSKEELLEILEETFPDREAESMKKTIAVQVPGRISKEKFELEKTKDGKYRKVVEKK